MDAVGIVGGGVIGAGVAKVAAANGSRVILLELNQALADEAAPKSDRTPVSCDAGGLHDCELIIEALPEDFELKISALAPLCKSSSANTVFASTTSRLSMCELGQALGIPERFCGMHFIDPGELVPLVELVTCRHTAATTLDAAAAAAERWGIPAVYVRDSPGYIVQRLLCRYYLEALRIIEETLASCDGLDVLLNAACDFPVGPFGMLDHMGLDECQALVMSLYERFGRPARFRPSDIIERLVGQGKLGRKTEAGFYSYAYGKQEVLFRLDAEPLIMSGSLERACVAFQNSAGWDMMVESAYVCARILCAIMNEAGMIEEQGVAGAEDIDAAMRLGAAFPEGPLAWAERIGRRHVSTLLRELNGAAGDDRFKPAGRFKPS